MNRNRILLTAMFFASSAFAAAPPTSPTSPTPPTPPVAVGRTDADDRPSRRAPTEDEALALAALEGLMAQPPERALPILKKVLSGSQSVLVKRRALFVLSQIDLPEAQTLLVDTARNGDPALRTEAIRSIGIGGNPKSLAVLKSIYDAGDAKVKREILQAWLISGSKDEIYQAAVSAKTDDEADKAIQTLSAMGARDELRKLGETRKVNGKLVQAYAVAGDLASLRKIAQGDSESSTRVAAVRSIGIIQSDEARTALREVYSSAKEAEIREAALQGMLIENDEQGVLALYRASKSPEEKRRLMRTLSMMNGDAALQAIDSALENRK